MGVPPGRAEEISMRGTGGVNGCWGRAEGGGVRAGGGEILVLFFPRTFYQQLNKSILSDRASKRKPEGTHGSDLHTNQPKLNHELNHTIRYSRCGIDDFASLVDRG